MDNKRKKKVKKENKLDTKQTKTGIHPKSKMSNTANKTNKQKTKNNVDENKINPKKIEVKNKTEVKIEPIIEKEKYIPFSCIPTLEDKKKDFTHNHELIQ